MCGISGVYAFSDKGRESITKLKDSTDAIESRGPDSQGHYVYDKVGLGHRRLSVLDVSSDGAQPMVDESGRYTIVFNGEIFNFLELKRKLIQNGYTFYSGTDTEVLLKLYITEGKDLLKKLNGFFAFAIYDKEEDSLFIARDRMGVKPLLIYKDEDQLLFASEMKAMLAFSIQRKIDFVSLYQYLQFNYIPGPASIFKGVKKLEPGHYLYIKKNRVLKKAWYRIPYDRKKIKKNDLSYEDQQKKLVTLLDEAVQRRLVADVPLGAFLSGGIDSSVIVALASRHTQHLNTFSIGYQDEPFFDETRYANLVADKYKTNHTVFSLTNQDLYDHLFDVLNYTDEPFADSSALAVYILSKRTREKVTVALSGDGADELFAGYNKHMGDFKVRQGGFLAEAVTFLGPLWDVLPKSRNSSMGNRVRQYQRFAEGMLVSAKDRYYNWATLADEDEANHLLSKRIRRALSKNIYKKRKKRILEHIHQEGDLNEVLYTDMQLVLPNDMLTKVDLMSMANSLEVRTPFLDYKVVNFAFSLPQSSKIDGGIKKKIVQDAFRPLLPAELYKRPKQGFEVPLLKWFRNELRPLITDELLSDDLIHAQDIFSVNEIRKLKAKLFSSNPEDVHARIWALIVFQHWWKKWMA
ncbi:asparagine synthase (glutamine-hydrolyzing) [Adhaeribacter radiodurans]|uniref:asparagine synthase (glutamine-hydrolyzing) n=1 Tax=Adhaeribacter radiodurans TaxID=2745197 RepID=A0A7L7LCK2_9BACT|nr:asparagine synthase (glutamine-hydrolyzing) [Adhaeribacter radiodurans]QMU30424.1 asparagine synthase (glutamine-hydrolyzing) [Adhaeribacter radiodurans]